MAVYKSDMQTLMTNLVQQELGAFAVTAKDHNQEDLAKQVLNREQLHFMFCNKFRYIYT